MSEFHPRDATATLASGRSAWTTAMARVVEDGVLELDADGRVLAADAVVAAITRRDPAALRGEHLSTLLAGDGDHLDGVLAALAALDPAHPARSDAREVGVVVETPDGEPTPCRLRLAPVADEEIAGFVGSLRADADATTGEFETAVDAVEEHAIFRLDAAGRVASWNRGARQLKGYEADEIVGEHVATFYTDADRDAGVPERNLRDAAERGSVEAEGWRVRADGTRFYAEVTITAIHDDGDLCGYTKVTRDRTEERERERELLKGELDEAFGRITDAFYALDADWRFTYVNEQAAEVLDCDADELVGKSIWDEFPEAGEGVVREEYERAMATQEPASFELFYESLAVWAEVNAYPSSTGLSVYFRDVTERKSRERALERYETIVETVQDGIYALDADENIALVNEAFCELTGFAREDLLGEHPTCINSVAVNEEANELAGRLARGEIDVATVEYEFQRADDTTVPVETRFALYEGDAAPGARCGVVRDVTDRKRRERELARRREQLAALVELSRLVHDITGAVIRQSTRDEIEALVVERLAAADSYEFAWIGEVDVESEEVAVRAEAGVEGYLDDVTIRVDDSALSDGPTGRAFRTGETHVARELPNGPDYEPWQDAARTYGYESSAAIPIGYEDALYGVLNVYSPRPDAFDGDEQAMFGCLGETIGHAIRAVERRNALMSEEVQQIELRLEDAFDRVGGDASWAGRITIDRTIPVGDGSFVQYVTATPDAVDALHAIVDYLPHVSIRKEIGDGDGDGDRRFELVYADPPITSLIASRGGRVTHGSMADRDLTLTVELPTDASVREVVEAVTDEHEATRVLAQRTTVPAATVRDASTCSAVLADLTDRQRAVLEAAYFSGYFEWPRETNAEDLAASMDISAPTLLQHLRKAHDAILASLLGDGEAA